MNNPQPGEHQSRLQAFVGEWSGSEHVPPNPDFPDGLQIFSSVTSKMDLGGWSLIMNYRQQSADGSGYGMSSTQRLAQSMLRLNPIGAHEG